MYFLLIASVFIIFFLPQECSSANILTVSTLPSPSHYIWHKHYLMELVRRGHNVTVLTREEDPEKHVNFTTIILEGLHDNFEKNSGYQAIITASAIETHLGISMLEILACENDFKTNGLRTLLNYPKDYKFDLIIWDLTFGRCLCPLLDRFGRPSIIATSPFGYPPQINYAFGGSISSAVPTYNVDSSAGLNFMTRLESYIHNYFYIFTRRYYDNPNEFKLAKDYFGSNIRTFDEFERDISLVFSNIDPILNYFGPLPPNVIPVGGLHISPVKNLPQDLLSILDNAVNGIIVVAFGGNVHWSMLGQQQQQALIEAFRKLKYTILLKSSEMEFQFSDNVIVKKWLPLNDLLAHPSVKLLITHGGSLTTYEALYHGIPIIGIPMFLDQFGNMGKIHNMKIGKSLSYAGLTQDVICDAVTEILENPVFYNNIKKASEIFRNQLQSPMERAVFWTEFVIEFGNADHLNLAARDFNILQRHDIDVLAVIFIVLVLLLFSVYFIFNAMKKCFLLVIKQKQD